MPWIDPEFPKTATPADWVGRVLGLNPGMMTGPGTNTYLVGDREPILIDTGVGVAGWMPLLETYMAERGWRKPARVLLTHRHKDHLGGVKDLLTQFPGTPVSKMIHKDTDLPAGITDLRDGQKVEADGVTLVPIHTPGHASDHLCYYVPETRALFTGDVVLGGSTTVIPRRTATRPVHGLAAPHPEAQRGAHLPGPRPRDRERQGQDPGVHRSPAGAERQILAVMGAGRAPFPRWSR
jgi:glyoxylase-like metal-dependent hydrolase (beta-lactamase superfamily II)